MLLIQAPVTQIRLLKCQVTTEELKFVSDGIYS